MKNYLKLSAALLIIATSYAAKAQDSQPSEQDNAAVARAIKESSGLNGLLKSVGLNGLKIESIEGTVDLAPHGQSYTDGPEIVIEKKISDRVRAQVMLAFQGLLQYEDGKFQNKRDWNEFFKEAKIIIDQDKNSKIPFVTIIGKQEIETAGFDSGMPNDDQEILHGLTRVKQAYAVQFQMGPELIKGIDSVMVAGFNTGSGSEDTMGEELLPASNGAMIVLTKKISDQIILSGGLTHIAYPEHHETRLNWGAVYQSQDGKNKIFFNQAIFNYNPLYPDSKNVWTVGYVRQLTAKDSVTIEGSKVGGVKKELALGYTRQITKKLTAGVEVRRTTCLSPENCTADTKVNALLKYQFGKDQE